MPFLPSASAILLRQFVPLVRQYASALGTDCVTDFGPVFLPPVAGLRVAVNAAHAPDIKKAELGVSCFALSELGSDDISKLLLEMHSAVPFVMLADYKVAERNMELPACLLMRGLRLATPAGRDSFDAFGGLEGLLYAKRDLFAIKERRSLLGGSLLCILAESLH